MQALITEAMHLLRARGNDEEAQREAVGHFREVAGLVGIVRRRRFTAALVEALLEATSRGLSFHQIFIDTSAHGSRQPLAGAPPAATADVIASKDGGEACSAAQDHDLHDFFQRIQPINPYEDFDATGLEYTASEHQGHDQSMMAALIHALSPRLIVEVGSWKGGSGASS